jgi:isopenicillin N synthase-like dioxygenase
MLQPLPTSSSIDIPLLDLDYVDLADAQVGTAMREALRVFRCIKLRRAELAMVVELHEVMRALFALPIEVKMAFTAQPMQPGYGPYGRAKALDTGAINLLETWFLDEERTARWPASLVEQHRVVEEFRRRMWDLGERLVELTAVALEVRAAELRSLLGPVGRGIHLMHYPSFGQLDDPRSRRQSRHCDMTLLTMLPAPSAPGFEICVDGQWVAVDIAPGEVLVTNGLVLEVVTGGAYRACLHTVEHSERLHEERYSTPFFLKPGPDRRLATLSSFEDPGCGEAPPLLGEFEKAYFEKIFGAPARR